MNSGQVQELNEELGKLGVPVHRIASYDDLFARLAGYINHLIVYDMNKLISLLYRLDVPEDKLRHYLQQEKGAHAAELIGRLMIDRQLQKIETRKQFRSNNDVTDEERW